MTAGRRPSSGPAAGLRRPDGGAVLGRVDVAALAYLALTLVAVGQVVAGRASLDDVLVFALPAVLLLVAGRVLGAETAGSAAAAGAAADRGGTVTGEGATGAGAVRGGTVIGERPGRVGAPRGGAAIGALALVGALLAGWAVVAFLAALPHAAGPDGFYDVKVRVVTPVADHNVLASVLLVGLAASAVTGPAAPPRAPAGRGRGVGSRAARGDVRSVLRGRGVRTGAVRGVLVGVTTLGLGATLSRGAAVAGLVVAVVVAIGAPLDLRRAAVRMGGGALAALALVLLAAATLGAAVPGGDGPTSVVSRGQLWRAGAAAVAQAPLVGVGLDGFEAVAADEGAADPRDHAHALPLQAAATVGVPAAALYLALWALLGVRGLRHPDPATRAVVLLGGGALFLHGLVDETAFRLPVELTLAVLLGLARTPSGWRRPGRAGGVRR